MGYYQFASNLEDDAFTVNSFGYEKNGSEAHWGPGIRSRYVQKLRIYYMKTGWLLNRMYFHVLSRHLSLHICNMYLIAVYQLYRRILLKEYCIYCFLFINPNAARLMNHIYLYLGNMSKMLSP